MITISLFCNAIKFKCSLLILIPSHLFISSLCAHLNAMLPTWTEGKIRVGLPAGGWINTFLSTDAHFSLFSSIGLKCTFSLHPFKKKLIKDRARLIEEKKREKRITLFTIDRPSPPPHPLWHVVITTSSSASLVRVMCFHFNFNLNVGNWYSPFYTLKCASSCIGGRGEMCSTLAPV